METQNKSKSYFTAEELLDRKVMDIPMLWRPFIPQKGLFGLTGSSDVGKSTLLRQLAIAVCLKKEFFLNYPLQSRFGNVVYISTEDSEDAIAASLSRQLEGIEPQKLSGIKFIFNELHPELTLQSILEKEEVDLIIVDAWIDLFDGNPNDVSQVRKSLNKYSRIAQENNCAIIILHHTGKNSEKYAPDKNRLNGSQGIEAKLRVLLEIRQNEGDERILSVLKGNYISSEIKRNSMLFRFDEESLLFIPTDKKIERNGILNNSRMRFTDDRKLAEKILYLKDKDGLSFERIKVQITNEFGEEKAPSLTSIKNIYNSVSRSIA